MTEFQFPVQDRADDLFEFREIVKAAVSQGRLDHEGADIAYKVAGKLVVKGARTCGQAADLLEGMSQAERRELVDGARANLGLKSLRQIEHEEAVLRAQQLAAATKPPTRIVFDGAKYVEQDLRSKDDISPGFIRPGVLAPTANELKAAKARVEAERKAQEEREEQERREAEVLAKVQKRYRESTVVSINGVRVTAGEDGRLVIVE